MTIDDDVFNGSGNGDDAAPLNELIEEAPVTRSAYLANTFLEDNFNRFAEAELADDKKFLLQVRQFDLWMVQRELIPADAGEDDDGDGRTLLSMGKASRRNEIRQAINRAATFGKGVWPPYRIEPYEQGQIWEVRLLEYFAEKLPSETTRRVMRYIVNKGTHWGQVSSYMHSELVQKRLKNAPEVALRFYSVEGQIRLTLKNIAGELQNLNEEMHTSYREAQRLMALDAPQTP